MTFHISKAGVNDKSSNIIYQAHKYKRRKLSFVAKNNYEQIVFKCYTTYALIVGVFVEKFFAKRHI